MITSSDPARTVFTLDHEVTPAELHRLVGIVREARYDGARDSLVLAYQDGRTVEVVLQQCKSHYCDQTLMVVREG